MVDLEFKSNFKRDFQGGQLVSYQLHKTVWAVVCLVISVVLTVVTWGSAWWLIAVVAIAWAAVSTTVNLVWANYDRVHANAEMRKKRARMWAAMQGNLPGRLVNTRQSNDPLRVIYGIVKTGGVWVYNKMSRADSQTMNTVIAWGEGEISGIATGIDSFPLFSGSITLNDLHTKGEFAYAGCSCDMSCYGYVSCSCNMACDGYGLASRIKYGTGIDYGDGYDYGQFV